MRKFIFVFIITCLLITPAYTYNKKKRAKELDILTKAELIELVIDREVENNNLLKENAKLTNKVKSYIIENRVNKKILYPIILLFIGITSVGIVLIILKRMS